MDPAAYNLTPAERVGLAILESGAADPDVFCRAVWSATEAARHFTAGDPDTPVAVAREGRAILLKLARLGLATLAGSRWQVTSGGRRLALRLQPAPRS